ncbi:NFACT family protein [bacterium]|nr:NFACT family protein [bacterium]
MQLDYITIKLAFDELYPHVMDTRIQDIISRGKRSVALILRNDNLLALLLSAEADNSRMHLVGKIPSRSEGRDEHFHRTLRHHIDGAIIEDFILHDGERIIEIHTTRKEFSGEIKRCRLVAELMGRHSNLILTDEEGVIIVSDRMQSSRDKEGRTFRAGHKYTLPSTAERIPLTKYPLADFIKFIENSDSGQEWGRLLLSVFSSVTPGFVEFIAENANLDRKLKLDNLSDEQIENLHHALTAAIDRFESNNLFPPFSRILEIKKSDDFPVNRALGRFYDDSTQQERIKRRENQWRKVVEARIKSLKKLVSNLEKDKSKARKSDEYRKQGDLIYAFLHEFKDGARAIEVDDIINPESGDRIKLKLLLGKDAVSSAREYHRRASRMSRGMKEITSRLEETENKLADFDSLLNPPDEILHADDAEFQKALAEIKGGKVRRYVKSKQPEEISVELPKKLRGENIHHYKSVEGHDIYVGGNDRANEVLCKWGRADDYWLHVKNIPGSHVLIPRRGEAIEFDTLVFAAQLAVYHSKVKGATKVPVDYTQLKYVNKPKGGDKGFVTYKKEKNILADSPDERLLKKRKVK